MFFQCQEIKKVLKGRFLSLLKIPRKNSLKNQGFGNPNWHINTAADLTSVTDPRFAAGGGVRALGQ